MDLRLARLHQFDEESGRRWLVAACERCNCEGAGCARRVPYGEHAVGCGRLDEGGHPMELVPVARPVTVYGSSTPLRVSTSWPGSVTGT